MLKPVAMARVRLVVLERDERAVMRYLGQARVAQLTREPAGPDTAPLGPVNRAAELARVEQVSARAEGLRRSLELGASGNREPVVAASLEEVEKRMSAFESRAGELIRRRGRLRERMAEVGELEARLGPVRDLDLPLDAPGSSAFLHFVTGSVPVERYGDFFKREEMALLPLAERAGRRHFVAMTTRRRANELDEALSGAGFQAEPLPVLPGTTTGAAFVLNENERASLAAELKEVEARLQSVVAEFSDLWNQVEAVVADERRVIEAEQNFPRTESVMLIAGWVPAADVPALERQVQTLTHGSCAVESAPAEAIAAEEIPVLLRQPRWLRPFGMLVGAYGLPQYRELEPTLFVAISYLLMFGMMFGDVGHGLVLAALGGAIWWRSRASQWRDVGLLLVFCGIFSVAFGVFYGSYFGWPSLKRLALWHDPLEGDPVGFMTTAIGAGIVLMSLGLVLNVINLMRRGLVLAGCLGKFGLAGIVFYWGTLVLLLRGAAIKSHWLIVLAVVLFVIVPLAAWVAKEPLEFWHGRGAGPGSLGAAFMDSFVELFEGVMSYLSNTISFVRLAAYAMSHSALLLAAFMMAEQIRHVPAAGGVLSVVMIVLGNLVAIVLEGIIAAVQALRLEYYEFFSKFYTGNGRPFEPFCLTCQSASLKT